MSGPEPVSAGNTIGFIFFGSLVLLCFLGMVVEYSSIFGYPNYEGIEEEDDSKRDKILVQSKSAPGRALLAFSFSRNLRKMFWTPQRDDDYLSVFNGIRVISMAYIIFGHTHETISMMPIKNPQISQEIIKSFYGNFIMGAFYAVDVFFFMSAFLGAYLMIPKLKGRNLTNLGLIYFHRFFRILPTLGLFLALILTFVVYLGSGPIWDLIHFVYVAPCKKYWWTTMLFINNFYPAVGTINCVNTLWYLANDMMFFMFLPIVVLAYCFNKFIGYIMSVFLIFTSMVTALVLTAVHNHPIILAKDPHGREIYHQPYTRYGAYFVGCLFGIFYYEWMKARNNQEFKNLPGNKIYCFIQNRKLVRITLQLISALIMVFLIAIVYTETHTLGKLVWPKWLASIFNAFHRPLFVAALALFLAGPMVGKTPILRFVFGGSAYSSWAKITFIVYLIHPLVLGWYYAQVHQATFFSRRMAIGNFFAAFILSYLAAVPIALLIESPVLQFEKLVLFPPKSKPEADKELVKGKAESEKLLGNQINCSGDDSTDKSINSS